MNKTKRVPWLGSQENLKPGDSYSKRFRVGKKITTIEELMNIVGWSSKSGKKPIPIPRIRSVYHSERKRALSVVWMLSHMKTYSIANMISNERLYYLIENNPT